MGENPIENMRARAEQCRHLSDHVRDRQMAEQLRNWESEIDADTKRLEAGIAGPGTKENHARQRPSEQSRLSDVWDIT